MKRLASLLLVLCLLCPLMAQAAEDYTVAEKLAKQLWAGSGFSGTLTVDVQSETGASTVKPIVLDADYIYVRETAEKTAEHRLDVTLMDGENALSAAYAQIKDGELSFQADVISPDWYVYAPGKEASPAQSQLDALKDGALAHTGAAQIVQTALMLLPLCQEDSDLSDALESYTTRIDVWMEGYREEALLDKTADGVTTMQSRYTIPSAAIKAQMKQLVLDVLADEELLMALYDAFGGETGRYYFNPALQNWYFGVIEELPLTGCITLSRTVSIKGDVLETRLSLPLYDAHSGESTLSYERTQGEGDLPDNRALRFETADHAFALLYQAYSSMTGVNVMQGTFTADGKAVAFTLKQEESLNHDDESRDVYGYDIDLTLRPQESESETQLVLVSRFMSRELKSAPTETDITLSVQDDDSTVKLHFNGSTRKKWEPEPLSGGRTDVSDLTEADLLSILPGTAVRFAALTAPFLNIPQQPAETAE